MPIAYALGVARTHLLIALGALLVVAIGVESARRWHGRSRALFTGTVGTLLREHEHARLSGATWLFLTLFVAVLVLARPVAIAASWAVTVGDAVAALAGRGWQSWRGQASLGRKTHVGSAACLAAVLLGAWRVAHLSLGASVMGAVLGTLAERPNGPGDDNARVALGTAAGILLWHMMFS
ncbi:MAG TPA: hypothetical protein VF041_21645 [Gemmatimonadaceae bacterium]